MSSSDATLLIRVLEELNSSSDVTYTCFRLPRVESSKGEIYFAKLGSQTHAEQYHGEAESLRLMYNACPGICPRLIASGTLSPDAGGRPYVISEYKDLRSLNTKSSIILAQKLAEMHTNSSMYSHGRFGFEVPTYCGVTRINNGWYGTWAEAYSAMTGVLLDGLEHSEPSVVKQGRVIQEKVIPSLLDPEKLAVEPMLLHGDLWVRESGYGILASTSC
jgi:protein-ribulosamine 3-kinase